MFFFFFSSRRRHTRLTCDWSSDVCSSDLAQVRLSAEGAHTRLSYDVKANVGGKLAQIGSRLVDAAAKKVADDFFRNFKENFASAAPGDPDLPDVSDTTLRFLAAGALLVFVTSMYFFLT